MALGIQNNPRITPTLLGSTGELLTPDIQHVGRA